MVFGEKRSLQKPLDGVRDLLQLGSADSVGFGNDGQPLRDAEQIADGEMLHCLRHDALVGRDNKHDCRNTASSGEHVTDEKAVAGNVNKADAERRSIRRREFKGSETEVDRDTAAFLFGKAIRINAGEGANQRRLAMVDVTSGPDNDGTGRVGHSRRSMRNARCDCSIYRLVKREASSSSNSGGTVRRSSRTVSSEMRPMMGGSSLRRLASSSATGEGVCRREIAQLCRVALGAVPPPTRLATGTTSKTRWEELISARRLRGIGASDPQAEH